MTDKDRNAAPQVTELQGNPKGTPAPAATTQAPTPRTDALFSEWRDIQQIELLESEVRKMERELAAEKKLSAACSRDCNNTALERNELNGKLAAAQAEIDRQVQIGVNREAGLLERAERAEAELKDLQSKSGAYMTADADSEVYSQRIAEWEAVGIEKDSRIGHLEQQLKRVAKEYWPAYTSFMELQLSREKERTETAESALQATHATMNEHREGELKLAQQLDEANAQIEALQRELDQSCNAEELRQVRAENEEQSRLLGISGSVEAQLLAQSENDKKLLDLMTDACEKERKAREEAEERCQSFDRMPDLEWAKVGAEVITAIRHSDLKKAVAAVDAGKVYVHRLLERIESAESRLATIRQETLEEIIAIVPAHVSPAMAADLEDAIRSLK